MDETLLVRLVLLAIEPNGGLGTRLVRLIEHAELMASGADLLQQAQGAFANENPTADTVANELDHVNAPFLELGKGKGASDPPHGRLFEINGAFAGGGETVQFDPRVDLLALAQIIIERIDLELLDQK